MNKQMIKRSNRVAHVLKTLGHPKRLLILCYLMEHEITVSELEEQCGLSQSQLSQFLKQMESLNLVKGKRDGNFVFYHLVDPQIKKLIKSLYSIYCSS